MRGSFTPGHARFIHTRPCAVSFTLCCPHQVPPPCPRSSASVAPPSSAPAWQQAASATQTCARRAGGPVFHDFGRRVDPIPRAAACPALPVPPALVPVPPWPGVQRVCSRRAVALRRRSCRCYVCCAAAASVVRARRLCGAFCVRRAHSSDWHSVRGCTPASLPPGSVGGLQSCKPTLTGSHTEGWQCNNFRIRCMSAAAGMPACSRPALLGRPQRQSALASRCVRPSCSSLVAVGCSAHLPGARLACPAPALPALHLPCLASARCAVLCCAVM